MTLSKTHSRPYDIDWISSDELLPFPKGERESYLVFLKGNVCILDRIHVILDEKRSFETNWNLAEGEEEPTYWAFIRDPNEGNWFL